MLGMSKTMVENAVKWIPKDETRGRKPKIAPTVKRSIIRCVKKDPFITSKQIKNDLNIEVDTSTIRKTLISEGLKARSARKVPLLSKRNIKQIIEFAKNHINWPKEKWRNILWSDETKVNLFSSDRGVHHARRPIPQEFNQKTWRW